MDGRPWEVRQSGHGTVVIPAEPGSYTLIAHAELGGELGRQTLPIEVVSYDTTPSVSDLLLGRAWDESVVGRQEMLQHMQRDLTFRSGDTVRTYAELYGLAAEAGTSWYRASYLLFKSGDVRRDYVADEWPEAQRFEFERRVPAPATEIAIESLDMLPRWIPDGLYLLRLEVEDLIARRPAGRATIALEVR